MEIEQPRERALLATRLAWMREGTRFFDAHVGGLADSAFSAPAALPRWTRAHLVAHVARNANALGNLLAWARTGIETPMYESDEQRHAEVEEGATQSAPVLRIDLDDAERRFAAAVASLPAQAWWTEVRTRTGRSITAAEVPWMRSREVWVHAVDLDSGASFADFPPAFVDAFLAEATAAFTARADCPAVELAAADTGGAWAIGPHRADPVVVEGTASKLLAWILGRSGGSGLMSSPAGLPTIPAWL
ncbi:MAG: maleylpyruvate isomerase family mycothiol-dependent enzyme [Acidimicrobiia bacterium]